MESNRRDFLKNQALVASASAAGIPIAVHAAEPAAKTAADVAVRWDKAPCRFCGTGCAVMRDQQTVGSYVDDATITSRVKTKFAEDTTVSAMAIGVETLKGVVQLSGFAKSADERSMAERLARGVPGVQSVKNDIVVRS